MTFCPNLLGFFLPLEMIQMWLCQIKVNDLKFKLPSVTLANYGTAVPGKYGQIKKLQIVFTGRYEAYMQTTQ